MKTVKKILTLVLSVFAITLFTQCGGSSGSSFKGTYEGDLTLMQSGKMTTIVINPDGSGYMREGDHYKSTLWWPADNGGGIHIAVGGGDNNSCYFMNKEKNKMYWGIDNYMNDRNAFTIKKISSKCK